MKKWVLRMALLVAAQACAAADGPAPVRLIVGEVMEALSAQSYTYLRIRGKDGETWVAVPRTEVRPGTVVEVGSAVTMTHFESRALQRRFDEVAFGELVKPAAAPDAPTQHAGTPVAGSPVVAPGAIARASGNNAHTVAEVVASKARLKGTIVQVRARVTKVSEGILGKTWAHIQDGSGSASDASNDIVITTRDVIAVGDVVTVNGTVRLDLELGPGYRYAVLIDDAVMAR